MKLFNLNRFYNFSLLLNIVYTKRFTFSPLLFSHKSQFTIKSNYDPYTLPLIENRTNSQELSSQIEPVPVNKVDLNEGNSTVLLSHQSNNNASTVLLNNADVSPLSKDQVIFNDLKEKYRNKLVVCYHPNYPQCAIYLCGTLHVSNNSTEMVSDVIQKLQPQCVLVELCEGRIDSLYEQDDMPMNLTLFDVIKSSYKEKSLKTFGGGMLAWLQVKAAKVMGSKLGGELSRAAKEAFSLNAPVILGDRLYGVTMQRIMDKLTPFEKLKVIVTMIWEVLTMSIFKISDYIRKTENDDHFVSNEITQFAKYLPALATVIIHERDEYIAQTIREVCQAMCIKQNPGTESNKVEQKVLAVVGAGHLTGIERIIIAGGVNESRINEISSSTKHNSTWPGKGIFHVVHAQERS